MPCSQVEIQTDEAPESSSQPKKRKKRNALQELWYCQGGLKEITSLTLPLIISEATCVLNVFFEKLILGRYIPPDREPGTDAAVVSVGWSTVSTIFYLFLGVIMFSASFISQSVGHNKPKEVGVIFWQTTYLSIICSFLALAFMPALRPLFSLLRDPTDPSSESLLEAEVHYSKFMLCAMISYLFDELCSAFFAGIERPMPLTIASILVLVVNVGADYVLILPMGFGYMGAAYGTIIAKTSGSLLLFVWALAMPLTRKTYYLLSRESMKPNFKKIFHIGFVGLGAGIMRCLDLVAWTGFLFFMQRVGVMEVTGAGYAQTVYEVAVLPIYAMTAALEVLVANYFGAKEPLIARRCFFLCIATASVYLSIIAVLFEFIPQFIINMFLDDSDFTDSDVDDLYLAINSGSTVLRVMGGYCFLEMLYSFLIIFEQTSGDTILPASSCAVGVILGVIGPGILLWHFQQLSTLYVTLLLVAYTVCVDVPLFLAFLSGRWKHRALLFADEEEGENESVSEASSTDETSEVEEVAEPTKLPVNSDEAIKCLNIEPIQSSSFSEAMYVKKLPSSTPLLHHSDSTAIYLSYGTIESDGSAGSLYVHSLEPPPLCLVVTSESPVVISHDTDSTARSAGTQSPPLSLPHDSSGNN